MRRLRIGMAQINATVGDFAGNVRRIFETISQVQALGVNLITFSEGGN